MKFSNFFKQHDQDIAAKVQAATKIAMSDTERANMRVHLSEYTKMRPIRAAEPAGSVRVVYYSVSTFFARHSMPVVAAVLVLAVGGSTAAAAESALPGELLYSIKVHVTEEVRSTLATSPKAKADWEMSRAERRLEEAAILALSGKLDDETRAELNTNLDAHMRSAGESREQLKDEDDFDDASEIETNIGAVLLARQNILDGVRKDASSAAPTATSIAATSDAASTMSLRAVPEVRPQMQIKKGSDGSEAAVRGQRTAAKARIEAAKKFLDRGQNNLTATTSARAREQLKNATEALSSGDTDATRGDRAEASLHFDSALEAATEIETLVSDSNDSNDDSDDNDEDGARDGDKRDDGSIEVDIVRDLLE